MSFKQLAIVLCILATSACKPAETLNGSIDALSEAMVPAQHREFARRYSDHLLAGKDAAGQAVLETRQFCIADFRRADSLDEIQAANPECSFDDNILRTSRYLADGREPDEVSVARYIRHEDAGTLDIDITMEYRFEKDVIRTEIAYRRAGGQRWIEKTTVTLDSMTLAQRMLTALDSEMLLPLWFLIGFQLLLYLAVPVIVFMILKRQRNRRAAMLDDASVREHDRFEA